jgi:thiol:disulfide interchange protein DsbC
MSAIVVRRLLPVAILLTGGAVVALASQPANSPRPAAPPATSQPAAAQPAAAPAKPSAPPATAKPAAAPAPVDAATRSAVAKRIPGVSAEDVRRSLVPGVLEVSRGAEVFYVTADARYVFAGDLYDLVDENNISERRRREERVALLGTVPESQMIVFGPSAAKYSVTVFTDIDCGFCRKLHTEMAKYNELGIRVRYLFYPRTGPGTESWQKAVSVWCSKDRNEAMNRAKRGDDLPAGRCGKTPVERDFEIGQDMAVTGTPAIVLPNGEMVPGYRAAPALLKLLQAAAR